MAIIGCYGGRVKAFVALSILLGILLAFQNCGEVSRTNDLLQDSDYLSETSCVGEESCGQNADYLWLRIREYEPYKIQIATVNGGHFNVGGQCGVGTFTKHSFLWEIREGFGSQSVVGQGFRDDRCINGQFSVPINPKLKPLEVDKRYTLSLELVGITETGAEVSNPMPSNLGTLDVIFTTEPPN